MNKLISENIVHFIFTFAHGCPKGRCSPPPPRQKNCAEAFPHVEFLLVPTYKNFWGAHGFAARVVPNNNVPLAEFERNCETYILIC